MPYQYHHGGDTYGRPDLLDFSVNINPLGMPPKAKEAAVKSLETAGQYPDWKCRDLTGALQEYYRENGISVRAERIVWGNGAAELIYALCELIILERKHLKAYIPAPTFSCYEEAVQAVGGTLTDHPEEADLIFICNPNNPTGTLWDTDELRAFADLCSEKGSLLCVDESFLPFLARPEDRSVVRFDNLHAVLLRSLTKIYAMPGLRLGYLLFPDAASAERIRSLLQPWNVSLPAQAAGREALMDSSYLDHTRIYIKKEKDFILPHLEKAADRVWDGTANFLFFKADEDFADKLLVRGIMIRRCGDIRGLSDRYFRIGIRTHEENVRFTEAIKFTHS